MEIHLEPDLSACIQTQAKREYERILKEILVSGGSDEESEQRIEILRMFLEGTDFNSLRSEYEMYLVEGKKVRFTLHPIENGTRYRFDVI